ncbi:hypothetical protein ACWM9A_05010 [Acetobacter pasteurianus]
MIISPCKDVIEVHGHYGSYTVTLSVLIHGREQSGNAKTVLDIFLEYRRRSKACAHPDIDNAFLTRLTSMLWWTRHEKPSEQLRLRHLFKVIEGRDFCYLAMPCTPLCEAR